MSNGVGRINAGNQITNGMQILSVAGTTASHEISNQRRAKLADASSALNNMSEEDVRAVGQMRANKLKSEVSRYNEKGESPYQHLSDEEAAAYQMKKADDMRKYAYNIDDENVNVDEVMSDTPFSSLKSPQRQAIETYISNNLEFSKLYSRNEKGQIKKATREDVIKLLKKGEDEDANG